MPAYKKELGKHGEEIAVKHIKEEGYSLIQTNFRCRLGEIDIIAKDGDYLVFIEVKTRSNYNYGFPAEAINAKKKGTIIKTAQSYLSLKGLKNIDIRFDVIEVIIDNKNCKEPENVKLIKNAF